MTVSAKIILDSVNPAGVRLTTLSLTYPRWILAEFNTHRVFSRSSASSRAIPTKKMLKSVRESPATFEFFGKNRPGMQATESMSDEERKAFETWWYNLADKVATEVEEFLEFMNDNYHSIPHKQMINRVLEPWLHMKTVVTATEWDNFFLLRCHEDAQPEIRVLAEKIRNAMDTSTPTVLQAKDWHMPFILPEENELDIETKLKVSAARCARVSYAVHGSNKISTVEQDTTLYNKLVVANPKHLSPTEHQAMAMNDKKFYKNFRGWVQHRSFIEEKE